MKKFIPFFHFFQLTQKYKILKQKLTQTNKKNQKSIILQLFKTILKLLTIQKKLNYKQLNYKKLHNIKLKPIKIKVNKNKQINLIKNKLNHIKMMFTKNKQINLKNHKNKRNQINLNTQKNKLTKINLKNNLIQINKIKLKIILLLKKYKKLAYKFKFIFKPRKFNFKYKLLLTQKAIKLIKYKKLLKYYKKIKIKNPNNQKKPQKKIINIIKKIKIKRLKLKKKQKNKKNRRQKYHFNIIYIKKKAPKKTIITNNLYNKIKLLLKEASYYIIKPWRYHLYWNYLYKNYNNIKTPKLKFKQALIIYNLLQTNKILKFIQFQKLFRIKQIYNLKQIQNLAKNPILTKIINKKQQLQFVIQNQQNIQKIIKNRIFKHKIKQIKRYNLHKVHYKINLLLNINKLMFNQVKFMSKVKYSNLRQKIHKLFNKFKINQIFVKSSKIQVINPILNRKKLHKLIKYNLNL